MSQEPFPSVNPYAPPPASDPIARPNLPRAYEIAVRQRAVLACILIQILVAIASFGMQSAPPAARLAILAVSLIAIIVSTVAVFFLAIELFGTVSGIVLGVLSLAPCLGLIVLLVVNGRATSLLKSAGYHVGLMGANLAQFQR